MNSDEADDREEVIKDPYVCVECGAEFATNTELDFHKRREHPPIQQRYDPREDSTSEEEDDFPFRYTRIEIRISCQELSIITGRNEVGPR